MKSLRHMCLCLFPQQLEDGNVRCGYHEGFSPEDADDIFMKLSQLGNLSYCYMTPLFDAALRSFKFPLTRLNDIGRVDILLASNLFSSFEHLTALDISSSAVTDYGLSHLVTAKMVALQSLNISRCPNLTMKGLKVLTSTQTLKVLRIDEFRDNLTKWPLLQAFEELSVKGVKNEFYVPISVLISIQQTSALTINKFHMTGTDISDSSWYTLLPSFEVLTDLNITIPEDKAEAFIEAVTTISTLKKLSINLFTSDMVNQLISSMLSNNIQLSFLSLQVPDITEDGLNLLSQMTSLESLHLKDTALYLNNSDINESTNTYLFAKLVHLKELSLDTVNIKTFHIKHNIEIFPRNLETFKVQGTLCHLFDEPLYTTLSCMTHLRVLHLDYYGGEYIGMKFLWHHLVVFNLPCLEEVYITNYSNARRHFLQALYHILNLVPKTLKILSFNCACSSFLPSETVDIQYFRHFQWPLLPRLEYLYLPKLSLTKYATELRAIQEICFSPYTQLLPVLDENKSEYYETILKPLHYHDTRVNPNYSQYTHVCEKYHTLPPSTDIQGEGMSITQVYECRHHITSQYQPSHMSLSADVSKYYYIQDDDDDYDYDEKKMMQCRYYQYYTEFDADSVDDNLDVGMYALYSDDDNNNDDDDDNDDIDLQEVDDNENGNEMDLNHDAIQH